MVRCEAWLVDQHRLCDGEAVYRVRRGEIGPLGPGLNALLCAACGRSAESGLHNGKFQYNGHTPERGEVVLESLTLEIHANL